MISWSTVALPAAMLVLFAVGGFVYAWFTDRLARRSVAAVERGRGLTVPMLLTVSGEPRRGRAVLDGEAIRVIGKGVNVAVGRTAYAAAAVRRGQVDTELLEYAQQRGFADVAGTRYLLGPVEEWEPAFAASLQRPARRASRLRLLLAAVPRGILAPVALTFAALATFQAVWVTGHDVEASMVRVVGDEGLESCGVRWHEEGRDEYAEVDCYPPFPAVGSSVRVRALAWPFDESAMDHEGTYSMATLLLGGAAVVLAAAGIGVAQSRLRRPPTPLSPLVAPAVEHVIARGTTTRTELEPDAPLPVLLDALAGREGWEEGVSTPPSQPWYARYLMALGAGTWWPAAVMAGAALLVEEIPRPVRTALVAGAAAVLLWAAFRAVTAWLAIRRAYAGSVTSEWDYRLVRSVEDEWFVLLFLGGNAHWMVLLDGPEHPAPVGRCGIRGDLEEGGAIQVRIGEHFWPTLSPVARVDEETATDIREDLVERLA